MCMCVGASADGVLSGHYRFSPSSYSLELTNVMSREAFQNIVDQLNACAEEYAPKLGHAKGALLCPCFAICIVGNMVAQYGTFRRELEATCRSLTKTSARPINLRVVEVVSSGYHHSRQELYVELEVLVPRP